jgi:hypothetical protein
MSIHVDNHNSAFDLFQGQSFQNQVCLDNHLILRSTAVKPAKVGEQQIPLEVQVHVEINVLLLPQALVLGVEDRSDLPKGLSRTELIYYLSLVE